MFDNAVIQGKSVFEYLTFFNEVSFVNTEIGKEVMWKNLSFAPLTTNTAKEGFKTFVTALNKGGYSNEADFYEQHMGLVTTTEAKINKDELDIAVQSDWLNIKQAAVVLGISYTTLLAMRKEDKADGVRRIPYIGEGKNSRYYFPLLKAYKSQNWNLVNELAKEMERK